MAVVSAPMSGSSALPVIGKRLGKSSRKRKRSKQSKLERYNKDRKGKPMTVNELIEKLEYYSRTKQGGAEAVIQIDGERHPILFIEDNGSETAWVSLATETDA